MNAILKKAALCRLTGEEDDAGHRDRATTSAGDARRAACVEPAFTEERLLPAAAEALPAAPDQVMGKACAAKPCRPGQHAKASEKA
jgi:hypothetical protein